MKRNLIIFTLTIAISMAMAMVSGVAAQGKSGRGHGQSHRTAVWPVVDRGRSVFGRGHKKDAHGYRN